MERKRGTLIAAVVILAFGGLLVFGGFSKYADAHSGTTGKATVSSCTRSYNTKYVHKAATCTGRWEVGGDPVFGEGKLGTGRIEGADKGDVGKTIDVRIHGTDHATVPGLGTPILLWVLGGAIAAFGLLVLRGWWRQGQPAA
jgi:hypothetical protein